LLGKRKYNCAFSFRILDQVKRMSSKQVLAWYVPIRKALGVLRSDNVDSIRGYPVIESAYKRDEYERIDDLVSAYVRCLSRILPAIDLTPLKRLGGRLTYGTPITVEEIDACISLLKSTEIWLIRQSWDYVRKVSLDEQIRVELDRLNIA